MSIRNCMCGRREGLISLPSLLVPPGVSVVGPGAAEVGMPSLNDAICFWNLDELAGVRADAVGTGCGGAGCDLTDNNTVGWAAGVSAETVNSAQFIAANLEYLSHVDDASLSTGDIDFTLTTWIYLDSKVTSRIFVRKQTGAIELEYGLIYNSALNRFAFNVSSNGVVFVSVVANSLGIPSINTWYFLVAWHDSTANTINIQVDNGAVDSLAHAAGVRDGTGTLGFGRAPGTAAYHDGRVDAAGFWKRLLTAAELTWLYNAGSGRQYPF